MPCSTLLFLLQSLIKSINEQRSGNETEADVSWFRIVVSNRFELSNRNLIKFGKFPAIVRITEAKAARKFCKSKQRKILGIASQFHCETFDGFVFSDRKQLRYEFKAIPLGNESQNYFFRKIKTKFQH